MFKIDFCSNIKLEQEQNVMKEKKQTMRKKKQQQKEQKKKNNGLDVSGNVCMTEFFSTSFHFFLPNCSNGASNICGKRLVFSCM